MPPRLGNNRTEHMDDQNLNDENGENPLPPDNEEVKQFSRWMADYGRPALIGLAVAVVVLLGVSIWRNQKQAKASAAVQALFQRRSPEELRQMAMADPEAPTAPMALASAAAEFYAQNRYDEALAAYQNFLSRYAGHAFAPDARIGVAASLEAMEDYAAAADSYETFSAEQPDSPLHPQAVMGAARCREQLGQFDEARALYEDFIAKNADSAWLPQIESGLLYLKKAERAMNRPAPAAGESVGTETTSEPAPEAAAPAVEEPKASTDETPAKKKASEEPAAAEESVAAETAEESAPEMAAPAVEEPKAATDETPAKKKRTSKKKAAEKPPAAEEPAAE